MSLVDYASSSDEDEPREAVADEQVKEDRDTVDKQLLSGFPAAASSSAPPPHNDPHHLNNRMPENRGRPPSKQRQDVSMRSDELKLPDASLLLNSPTGPINVQNASDLSSRFAAATAESVARKRDLNGSSSGYPRSKIPKGAIPHPKNVPDTVGGRLLPPQLAGRSNVVTEDISKLFVRKHVDSSTQ